MSVPTIRTTTAELNTERFWVEHVDPVARAHGIEYPTQMHRDPGDPDCHMLKHPDGRLLLVVRTHDCWGIA